MRQGTQTALTVIASIITTMQLHTADYSIYNIDTIQNYAVYDAVKENNVRGLEYLLKNISIHNKNQILHYQDPYGNTPLTIAAYNNNNIIAEMLVKDGAHVNIQNNAGLTPIHTAADNENVELMDILLDIYPDTILSSPVANPNIQDENGNTPLHYAAKHSNQSIIIQLLSHGSDPHIKNKNQISLLDFLT